MLSLIRSPVPGILHAKGLPACLGELLQRVAERPQRFVWVVPTGRRRRAMVREWLEGKKAAILPKFHTVESFVAWALERSVRQQRQIGGPERVLRLARLWQEITGRTAGAGLIHQLDRFVRDWQACRFPVPSPPKDDFERLVLQFSEDLAGDGCLDRMGSIRTLLEELGDGSRPLTPPRVGERQGRSRGEGSKTGGIEAIIFDGFHRLERLELELIAALGKRCEVFLWMVGVPGQRSWGTVEGATKVLQDSGGKVSVIDHRSEGGDGIAQVGRRLFQADANPQAESAKPQAVRVTSTGIFKLEAASVLAEVEEVAKQIKNDVLESQAGLWPLRLSDVAVVIPGPGYDPLIREAFPRAGLEFNLAGRALLVSTSRPARVLTAAVQVVRGQWRYDLLLDFLNHPLVKRRLKDGHRLHELFDRRPRARRRLDYPAWSESWNQHLQKLRRSIEGWKTGRIELPEGTLISGEEYIQRQTELADSLERLIASIQIILEPVGAIDRLVGEWPGGMLSPPLDRIKADPGPLGGESMAPMRELIRVLVELLRVLEIGKWLTPPDPLTSGVSPSARRGSPDPAGSRDRRSPMPPGRPTVASGAGSGDLRTAPAPVLWVEYEKDQQAYYKLLSILETLKDLPAARMPADPLRALELALDGETYQIKTDDDAGVQIFEIREIRGLRFGHVYMLGLVNGQVPALPEEGMLATRRRQIPPLNGQLQQKETENEYLFSQLFEAAEEKLVLSRPTEQEDEKTLPSPFLTAVEELVELPSVRTVSLVVSMREAASGLGMREAAGEATSERGEKYLEPVVASLVNWRQKPRPQDLTIDWPELWQILFADDYLFSASQLETYAACPFRFFGKQVLHLEEREPDPTRRQYGSLVHRVLQRYYAESRQRAGLPEGKPLPAVGKDAQANLVRLFREELNRLDEGAIPPHLEKLFCRSGGVLDLFLEVMDAIKEQEFGNLATELVLPRILLGPDKRGRPVFLTGKIDRVDGRRDNPSTAIIIDYKTGKIVTRVALETKVADGRMLQLPLYAAGLQIFRSDLQVIGGAYLHLNEKKKDNRETAKNAIVLVGALSAKEEDSFDLQAARRLAIELAGEIRAGRFPWTRFPKGRDEAECTRFCPLRHACRHPGGYESLQW